jgi:hypothetical protein
MATRGLETILRLLVNRSLLLAGMPLRILDADREYQEALVVQNTIAGGIGRGVRSQ